MSEQLAEEEAPGQPVAGAAPIARMRHPQPESEIQRAHQKRNGGTHAHRDLAHLRVERRGGRGERRRITQVVHSRRFIADTDAILREHRALGAPVERGEMVAGKIVGGCADQMERLDMRLEQFLQRHVIVCGLVDGAIVGSTAVLGKVRRAQVAARDAGPIKLVQADAHRIEQHHRHGDCRKRADDHFREPRARGRRIDARRDDHDQQQPHDCGEDARGRALQPVCDGVDQPIAARFLDGLEQPLPEPCEQSRQTNRATGRGGLELEARAIEVRACRP